MPVDPSISLAAKASIPLADPLQQAGQALQIRNAAAQGPLIQQQVQEGALGLHQKKLDMSSDEALRKLFTTHAAAGTDPTDSDILGAAGPRLGTPIIKARQEAAKAHADLVETKGKIAVQEADYAGSIAAMIKSQGDTPDAFERGMQMADQAGYKQTADQLRAQASQDPSQIPALTAALITKSTEQQKQISAAKTAGGSEKRGNAAETIAGLDVAAAPSKQALLEAQTANAIDEPKSREASRGIQTRKDAFDQQVKTAELKQRDQQIGVEQHNVAIRQKTFDATFGSGLDANGKPLSPEERKTVALSDPTATAIANYQIPPPANRMSGPSKAIYDKVLAIDPNYDGTKFAERNKITQDYSASGKTGQAITSADTALAHLDAISKAGAALKNSDFKALNSLALSLGAQVGQSPKNTYDTIVSMVAPEISKAVIGAGGGVGERENYAAQFGSSLAPEVREQAIGAAASLLGARVHKQAQAYESDMGKPLARKLSPESQAVLDRYSGGGQGGAGMDPKVKAYADQYFGGDVAKAQAAIAQQRGK